MSGEKGEFRTLWLCCPLVVKGHTIRNASAEKPTVTTFCDSKLNRCFLLHLIFLTTLLSRMLLKFPHKYEKTVAAAKSLQSCPTLCDPLDGSPQAPLSLGFSGKNPGVGCHCLLQCMRVKSESEVAQSCRTLSDPMVCSLPGSSVHGIFQARVLEWGAIAFSEKTGSEKSARPSSHRRE